MKKSLQMHFKVAARNFHALNLPSNFVGASAMLRVEPFLKENVVVWSILLPLKTVDTHLLGLRIKSRSEHLSMVSKRDWWSSGEEEKTERSSAKALAEWLDELKNFGLEVSSLIFLSGNWGDFELLERYSFCPFLVGSHLTLWRLTVSVSLFAY